MLRIVDRFLRWILLQIGNVYINHLQHHLHSPATFSVSQIVVTSS